MTGGEVSSGTVYLMRFGLDTLMPRIGLTSPAPACRPPLRVHIGDSRGATFSSTTPSMLTSGPAMPSISRLKVGPTAADRLAWRSGVGSAGVNPVVYEATGVVVPSA